MIVSSGKAPATSSRLSDSIDEEREAIPGVCRVRDRPVLEDSAAGLELADAETRGDS